MANENGNSFVATLDAPSDLAPTGLPTISDSADNSCQAGSWTEGGSDGHGGENFTATCDIENAEVAGDTVTATYVGSDYTAPISQRADGGRTGLDQRRLDQRPPPSRWPAALRECGRRERVSDTDGDLSVVRRLSPTEIPGATSVIYAVQTSDVGQSIPGNHHRDQRVGTAASATSNSLSVEDPATITSASDHRDRPDR